MSKESNDITLHSSRFNAPITDFRLIEPTFIFRHCRFVQRNGMTFKYMFRTDGLLTCYVSETTVNYYTLK